MVASGSIITELSDVYCVIIMNNKKIIILLGLVKIDAHISIWHKNYVKKINTNSGQCLAVINFSYLASFQYEAVRTNKFGGKIGNRKCVRFSINFPLFGDFFVLTNLGPCQKSAPSVWRCVQLVAPSDGDWRKDSSHTWRHFLVNRFTATRGYKSAQSECFKLIYSWTYTYEM